MNEPLNMQDENKKRLRNRNVATFFALLGFVALVFIISIVKMTINTPPSP